MSKHAFAEDEDGIVHLIQSLNTEYTLCGDAFDGFDVAFSGHGQTKKRIVTCPGCAELIRLCRGVRTRVN
jgi:hypothetical protein